MDHEVEAEGIFFKDFDATEELRKILSEHKIEIEFILFYFFRDLNALKN